MKLVFRNLVVFIALTFILVLLVTSCQQKKTSTTNIDDKLSVQVKNLRKSTIKFMYSDGSIAYLRGWNKYAYFLLSRNGELMKDSLSKFEPMKYAQSVYRTRLWLITKDSINKLTFEEIDISKSDTCKCGPYQCATSLANFDCFTDMENRDRYPCPISYPSCPDCKNLKEECSVPPPADFCSFMQSNCDKWFPVSGEIKAATCGTNFLCEAFK